MWVSFQEQEPERNQDVLIWCGYEECVKQIEDFRSEEASNNWLLWMPLPLPSKSDIDRARLPCHV